MSARIRSCPFCGGAASLRHTYDSDDCYWAHIQCNDCGARTRGKWAHSRSDACPIFYSEVRDEWNCRARDQVRSTETEGLGPEGVEPGEREAVTRPAAGHSR